MFYGTCVRRRLSLVAPLLFFFPKTWAQSISASLHKCSLKSNQQHSADKQSVGGRLSRNPSPEFHLRNNCPPVQRDRLTDISIASSPSLSGVHAQSLKVGCARQCARARAGACMCRNEALYHDFAPSQSPAAAETEHLCRVLLLPRLSVN